MDSRLRRSPPDRASAVPYGQAGENALRFPHLAHRSAAAHKLHSTTATTRYEFDSAEGEIFSRQPALAYSPRKLSKQPEPSQLSGCAQPLACAIGLNRLKQPLAAGRIEAPQGAIELVESIV